MEAVLRDHGEAEIVISVRQLYKYYRVGDEPVKALNGVDFDVLRGEFLTIVGASGSGKSTLLNMLAGLEAPSYGSIVIDGTNIVGLSENELVCFRRDKVGFIFQSFNLIQTLTAVENVALPLAFRGEDRELREKKAKIMLYKMGLASHMEHRPKEMSGGQQQRVGIARALVVQPSIIFADEPTGNLDSHTSAEIMSILHGISRQYHQTVIMVTHDDQLARVSDRMVRILDGKIVSVEKGDLSPEDLKRLRETEDPQSKSGASESKTEDSEGKAEDPASKARDSEDKADDPERKAEESVKESVKRADEA